jgi:uncharacterized membrane protein YdbT with pleckstrin-like domain
MGYIDRVLGPGEEVRLHARLHWICYLLPTIWLAGALSVGFADLGLEPDRAGWLYAVMWLLAIVTAIRAAIARWTTEIAVTDRRIIVKRGLIRRDTAEVNMSRVESIEVRQSILGRLLDYGTVSVRGTGAGIAPLRRIAAPLEVRAAVFAV